MRPTFKYDPNIAALGPNILLAMACLDPSQKFALITKNLAEVLNPELIEQVLAERDLKVYWGTENLLCSPFGTKIC